MTPLAQRKQTSDILHEGMRIGGEKVIATVPKATVEDVRRAFRVAREY